MQITRAMKMVSAAKLKKAKDALSNIHPYAQKIEDLLTTFSSEVDSGDLSGYLQESRSQPKLIIAISSNRGLCGGFNASIARMVIHQMIPLDQPVPYLLTIGKKARDLLSAHFQIYQDHSTLFDSISYTKIALFCNVLIDQFLQKYFHSIHLVYNRFKNAAVQEVISEQILPIEIPEKSPDSLQMDYLLEPSKTDLLNELIPKAIKIHLFNAILESYAAEQGARMSAMHKATDNASDLKSELLLIYNKARQTAITKEILEIVGGAEALNS